MHVPKRSLLRDTVLWAFVVVRPKHYCVKKINAFNRSVSQREPAIMIKTLSCGPVK